MLKKICRGTKLCERVVIFREINRGKFWGLYKTFAGEFVLCSEKILADKWINTGLIPREFFNRYSGDENFLFTVSGKDKRLEYLPSADSPDSIDEAISFAASLKRSREIFGDATNFGDAIFCEEFSCLLPTYESSDFMPDDIVLGRWLTGGVPVSVKKLNDIQSLMSWTSIPQIKKIVTICGIEDEEPDFVLPDNPARKTSTVPDGDFILPGRKELTNFFNDHVVDIIRRADEYAVMGIDFPGSVIMYGPPGSGKTYAAESLAEFLGWATYYINSGTIGSKYIHETSKKISEIFNAAMKNSPAIIIIDEMETFLSGRSDTGDNIYHTEEVGEFLRLLQKAKDNRVLVLAMTNMPDVIDEAVKRRGRFDHIIKVDMPTEEETEILLKHLFLKMPVAKDVRPEILAKTLQGHSPADIVFFVRETGRRTVKAGKKIIDQSVVDEVIREIKKQNLSGKSIGFKSDKKGESNGN